MFGCENKNDDIEKYDKKSSECAPNNGHSIDNEINLLYPTSR